MTTNRQVAANRQNAQSSTGPRTTDDKATASRNRRRQGLHAAAPVIPRLECADAWEQHRAGTVAGLSPVTPFEETLAESIALILWRLGRVARYERAVTSQEQAQAPADVADDDDLAEAEAIRARFASARARFNAITRFRQLKPAAPMTGFEADATIIEAANQVPQLDFRHFSVPGILTEDDLIADVPGWTAARVHQCVDAIARAPDRAPDELLDAAQAAARERYSRARVGYRRLARRIHELRQERILPQSTSLDRVMRYEAHLSRQLAQSHSQADPNAQSPPVLPQTPH